MEPDAIKHAATAETANATEYAATAETADANEYAATTGKNATAGALSGR